MDHDDIQFPTRHHPLREDVRALAQLMDEVLREQGGEELWQLVDQDRLTASRWRAGVPGAAEALAVRVRGRPPRVARELVRAFSAWFQLVNVAEKVHRIRRRREYFQQDSERPQPGGVEDALAELKASGLGLPEVLALLAQLSIEPVLLAHPMESTRRTSLRRQQRMASAAARARQRHAGARTSSARCSSASAPRSAPTGRPRSIRANASRSPMSASMRSSTWWKCCIRIMPAFYQEIAAALGKLYGVSSETSSCR